MSIGFIGGHELAKEVKDHGTNTAEVATAIITYIEDNYFDSYAIVAWIGDVEVVRGSHYVKGAT
jgi:hypothetical protein